MGTKWKKFRYGSEDVNPMWGFCATVICLSITIISYAMAVADRDSIWWILSYGFAVLSVMLLAYVSLMVNNNKKDPVPIEILDRWKPDLLLTLFLWMIYLYWPFIWRNYSRTVAQIFDFWYRSEMLVIQLFLVFLMTMLIAGFVMILFLSVIRHLGQDKLTKTLFFYLLFRFIRKTAAKWSARREKIRAAAASQSTPIRIRRRRQLFWLFVQIVVNAVILFFCLDCQQEELAFLILFMNVSFILLYSLSGIRSERELGLLLNQIRRLSEDSSVLDTPVLRQSSMFRVSEEELLTVQKIKKESLEKQLQSERMKVDLITNVSHDLKTPLTSMVGCIDLLTQTEGLPQEAKDYVKLLSVKAERLREMIQDVFDMAKATSGGQDMNIERLDMTRLLRQTLADMQTQVDESGLVFRIRMEDKELPFMGDGRKLYRVYQNLIENSLKYSMAGSRVYIEATEKDGKIITSIKNTSNCEMDFSAEEIVERFVRGDKNRSTEGNGLGLAIAKSFTAACGGDLQVTIDGDLFKVEIVFPKDVKSKE